ncbi:TlpA family protein disulfide reductase [Flavilitoribacter nigricans]|uniref:Thioredoxin domain-containing protein n=1 Tax=Flavilitoribacter nigricans (strain ATCC 23147 / DSM 23189 / NBRC 102662 / NCIMB 1420 / SS-2) TaxID=1122177 RepID=A0A2D0NCN5_FLAN2|nr:TlpA disulfide reductase family protein [Flavilitoribacter nigricans]PHN05533.1 hypothetical protein CRP01_16200 [Flavilitoribacter nigricans DSM 23189 = NBRC 102662]
MKNSLSLLSLVLLITSCQEKPTSFPEKLDYFFNPQETTIELSFPDIDTVDLSLSLWQHIERGYKLDTIIEPAAHPGKVTKSLLLEKPLLVEVTVNGYRDEIFLLPNKAYAIEYAIVDNGLSAKFSDQQAGNINLYYDQKSSLVDNHDIRFYYSSLASSSTFEKVIDKFDALESSFLDLLSKSRAALQLPDWFVEYESKNIKTASVVYALGLAGYQEYLGVESGSSQTVENRIETISIEDTMVMMNNFHLGLLDIYLSESIDRDKLNGPAELYLQLHQNSSELKSERVRDLFNAKLLSNISKSGYDYPETLKASILASISPKNRNYVDQRFNTIEMAGEKAPYFYLKNTEAEFIDSKSLEGNLVLLNFWSTSCPPCFKQFPFENELLEALKGERFELVKICMDTPEEKWKTVLKKHQVQGINLISNPGWDKKLNKGYNNPAWSQYMLISAEGEILIEKSLKPDDPELLKLLRSHL